MNELPKITKTEFKRFVKDRYPGARYSTVTGTYMVGTHEYRDDELWVEAQAEKQSWLDGIALKPDWVKA